MPDPLFGVRWQMDSNASLFSLGSPPAAQETRHYEEVPNGYRLTVDGSRGGQRYNWGYTALYDGADHSVTGRPDVDAIQAFIANDRITIGFFKKNGVDVAGYQRVLSADGNTLKVFASGKRSDNSTYFDVISYTK